jgi:hypothetical protein
MALSNQSHQEQEPLGRSSAEELDLSCLRLRIGEDQPRHLPGQERGLIGNLLYFTNVAIVIQWLRLLERESGTAGVEQLLTDFERLVFADVSESRRPILIEHLDSLIKLTVELQQFSDNKSMSKEECSSKMLGWCRKWLGTVSTDENFPYRVGIAENLTLLTLVHRSIGELGGQIQAILSAGY